MGASREDTVEARPMTKLESLAVSREAKRQADELLKDKSDVSPEVRSEAIMKEYEKITGMKPPVLSDTALVTLKNQANVEKVTIDFIDDAKAQLGIPKFDDGLFRIRPEPTPPAPMPTRPRGYGLEA